MINNVKRAMRESDSIVIIVDIQNKPKEALKIFNPGKDWDGPPVAVVLNKIDLV